MTDWEIFIENHNLNGWQEKEFFTWCREHGIVNPYYDALMEDIQTEYECWLESQVEY